MTAEVRLTVVLVGSFLLWSPALSSLLRGDLDAGAAGIRAAFALALTWTASALLAHLVGGYQRAADPVPDEDCHRDDDEPSEPGVPVTTAVGAGGSAPPAED